MEFTNIRISKQNLVKIKTLAAEESEKRGAHISSAFVLSEILKDYFDKKNSEGFVFGDK